MKKKVLALMMVAAMVIGLTACGSRAADADSSSEAAPAAEAASGAAATLPTKDASTDEIKIAYCVGQMDTNALNWKEGIEQVASGYPNGNVTVTPFDAQSSVETQSQQIAEAVNQGYDAIIINVADTAAVATPLKDAMEAGVGVYALNIEPQTPVSALIAADAYTTGVECAKDASAVLGGSGKCVLIASPVALATMVKGHEGFENTAKEVGLEVLETQNGDWTVENGNELARNFLTKYNNDIQVIWCQNDQMAIGAAQAVDAAGLTGKVLVYGADGTSEAIEYIRQGKMRGSCAFDNVGAGATAARLALYDVQSGNSRVKAASPIIYNLLTLVTPENVEGYAATHGM